MGTKYADGKEGIKWKWFEERGFRILADRHQYAYAQALFSPTDDVQGVFCDSAAGTGKTTIAGLVGAYEVIKGNYDRIIYIRNTVSVRDSGFLPGDIKEKESPYMAPIADALEHVQPGTFESWQAEDNPRLICLTTAYTRGVNWSNAFIIIDEGQNFDMHELQTVHTRATASSKIVTIGSTRQVDNTKLKRIAGLLPFEIMMLHFRGQRASFHKLETNYRGEWSKHADEVAETVRRLLSEGLDAFADEPTGAAALSTMRGGYDGD
jgi:predicted ribonuclease YlaK